MAYKKYQVKFAESFNKDFKKLDHYTQIMIIAWVDKHIDGTDNPRSTGKALANKVITMKSSVSGKTYKIKTNSKGIAKTDLWVKNKPLGKYYKYTFKYSGNKYYNSYSKTFKIKIIK